MANSKYLVMILLLALNVARSETIASTSEMVAGGIGCCSCIPITEDDPEHAVCPQFVMVGDPTGYPPTSSDSESCALNNGRSVLVEFPDGCQVFGELANCRVLYSDKNYCPTRTWEKYCTVTVY